MSKYMMSRKQERDVIFARESNDKSSLFTKIVGASASMMDIVFNILCSTNDSSVSSLT